jgi:hypothetical protein
VAKQIVDYGKSGSPFGSFIAEYVNGSHNAVRDIEIIVDEPNINAEKLFKIELLNAQRNAKKEWYEDHKLPFKDVEFKQQTLPPADIANRAKILFEKFAMANTSLDKAATYVFTGVIPWKLFKCDIIMVDKDLQYLDEYKPILKKYNTILKTASTMPPDEKEDYYAKLVEEMSI